MAKYDVVVAPTFGGTQLLTTNLTGHPVVCVPTGLDEEGHPTSVSFIGGLFEEAKILRVAKAFQEATSYDDIHPPMFRTQATQKNVLQVIPGHAHNDYEHERPLLEALENGYVSVEVDVHLIGNEIFVSHNKPSILDSSKTLESLYLDPLKAHISANGGAVYSNYQGPFYLMIDVKTDAQSTYVKLEEILNEYRHLIASSSANGPVTIFISGNRAIDQIINSKDPLMLLDGRPDDLEKDIPSSIMPVISQNYRNYLSWDGYSELNPEEEKEFKKLVQQVHAQGKKLRLWASPDNENVWKFLMDNGVDLINSDHLESFRKFYIDKSKID